jgi:hypothetical protein
MFGLLIERRQIPSEEQRCIKDEKLRRAQIPEGICEFLFGQMEKADTTSFIALLRNILYIIPIK